MFVGLGFFCFVFGGGCGSQFWIANLYMCVDGFGFLVVDVV